MADATNSTQHSDGAADYAQAQKCFYPHRDSPFCFHAQLERLQDTILQKGGGLIEPLDLVTQPLPSTQINLDLMDEPEPEPELGPSDLPHLEPVDLVSFTLVDGLNTLGRRRLPLEKLDLGCDLQKDVDQYLNSIASKISCNVLYGWFPMSPVDVDKDEGLLFPSTTSRWQQLALRELRREKVKVSDKATKLLQDFDHLQTTYSYSTLEGKDFGLSQLEGLGICPVSPPMSPPSESDVDGPFIPSPRVTIIDLTSEPSSPANPAVRKLQQDVQNGTLDSGPIAPSARSSSPFQDSLQHLMPPQLRSSDFKIEVPMIASSPNDISDSDSTFRTTEFVEDKPVGSELDSNEVAGFFDEAMEAILKSCHTHTNHNVESEQLNTTHSLLRMDIPSLSVKVPNPEWHNHLVNPEAQFRWMKVTLALAFSLKHTTISTRLCADLKWSPIPRGSGQVSLKEFLDSPRPECQQYLALETPRICSGDYITCPKMLSILDTPYDEGIGADSPSESDDTYPTQTEIVSRDSNLPKLCGKDPLVNSLHSRFFDVSHIRKRKAVYDPVSILPLANDSGATTKLLSTFLEFRCKKKFKTSGGNTHNRTPRNEILPAHTIPTRSPPQLGRTNVNLSDAPTPEFVIPSKPYRLIVSTSLTRSILSQFEKEWPRLELVDKDFSQYNEMTRTASQNSSKGLASRLSFEADISVSPKTGIILTSLLKVKQKPLPGSNLSTPLYQRVQQVSEKYESLFILVSTANPMGEYMSDLSESDRAAYSNFVQFTNSLHPNISTELVHGAEKTLCKWALSIIAPSAERNSNFGSIVTSKDTSWGLYLRRAGINIFASQVLELQLTAQYGEKGMDHFSAMSPEERKALLARI